MKAKVYSNAFARSGDFSEVEVLEVRSHPDGKPNKKWHLNDTALYNLSEKGVLPCLVKYPDGTINDNVWINKKDLEMKDSLKQDLQSLTCEGNVAKLPVTQLNSYPELKKALVKAGGVYKRNTFVFRQNAQDVINAVIGGETDFKKKYQFFATPDDLADRMAHDIIWDKPIMKIKEPGAGHGALIDAVLRAKPDHVDVEIHATELSDLNYSFLVDKYNGFSNVSIVNGDFLQEDDSIKYDLIIANPPFTKNQDIDHIRKMHDLLAKDGRIITLSSQSWYNGSQKKQVAFRGWLDDEVASVYSLLDNGVFKSSGTNVGGVYVVIDK